MNLRDLPDLLDSRIDYPAETARVLDRVGETRVDAPDLADSKTVEDLLEHRRGETFDSHDELFEAILSSLPDEYIGRKFYDDRGRNPEAARQTSGRDSRDQSF